MTSSTSRRIQTGMGAVMTAVGVAGTLAPQKLGASSGAAGDGPGDEYLTQMWALREGALGLILLGTRNAPNRRVPLGVTIGLTIAEAVVCLRSPALAGRSRWGGAVSAAVFGAASAYALMGNTSAEPTRSRRTDPIHR